MGGIVPGMCYPADARSLRTACGLLALWFRIFLPVPRRDAKE